MSISDFLTHLHQRGAELSTDGEKLRVRGDNLLAADDRAAIRQHKPEIIAHLLNRERFIIPVRRPWFERSSKIDGRTYPHTFDAGQAFRDGEAERARFEAYLQCEMSHSEVTSSGAFVDLMEVAEVAA